MLVRGTNGNDLLFGTPDRDVIHGLGGNDQVQAEAGADLVFGNAGDDSLVGGLDFDAGDGNDEVYGGPGRDDLSGGEADDYLSGDLDPDWLYGGFGRDVLAGGPDGDLLFGGADRDILLGGDDDDRLWGQSGNDRLEGGAGDDLISAGEGADHIQAGPGDDTVQGGAGNDRQFGDTGRDWLEGAASDDRLDGGPGNDRLDGGTGGDVIAGGPGDDVVHGDAGPDTTELLRTLSTPEVPPGFSLGTDVAMSGNLVAATADLSSDPDRVFVFDARTGQVTADLSPPTGPQTFSFGADLAADNGKLLVGSDRGTAYLYDAGGTLLRSFVSPDGEYGDPRVAISGDRVLVANGMGQANGGSVNLFDANSGALLHSFENPDPEQVFQFGWGLAVSEEYVAIIASTIVENVLRGEVFVYATDTGELLRTIAEPEFEIQTFGPFGGDRAIDIVGDALLIGDPGHDRGKGAVFQFDLASGNLARIIEHPNQSAFGAGFGATLDADGGRVAISSGYAPYHNDPREGEVLLFDVLTGKPVENVTFAEYDPQSSYASIPVALSEGRVAVALATPGMPGVSLYGPPDPAAGGADRIDGGMGRDELHGGPGDDVLSGGDGVFDRLFGDGGDDVLDGGADGYTTMSGGPGEDTFVFTGEWGQINWVLDFEQGDRILFRDTRVHSVQDLKIQQEQDVVVVSFEGNNLSLLSPVAFSADSILFA
jgi:Ca2+-binding RTX toxin-like protein